MILRNQNMSSAHNKILLYLLFMYFFFICFTPYKQIQCKIAEWFRALDSNAVTQVQIPLWPLAGVVLGKCLVQLLGHPCK